MERNDGRGRRVEHALKQPQWRPPGGEMLFRAVLFDLYDTLVHETPTGGWEEAEEALTRAGVDARVWARRWRGLLVSSLRGEVTLLERVKRALIEAGGDGRQHALVDELAGLMYARSVLRTYPDTRPALAELRRRGYRLALVSNIATYRTGWLHEVELAAQFDALALSCELGMLKPEPQIYRRAIEQLTVAAQECVFVADGCFRELPAARALGMAAVRIDRQERDSDEPRDEEYDLRVESLQQLLAWLPPRAGIVGRGQEQP